jgi:hypothetical protein
VPVGLNRTGLELGEIEVANVPGGFARHRDVEHLIEVAIE